MLESWARGSDRKGKTMVTDEEKREGASVVENHLSNDTTKADLKKEIARLRKQIQDEEMKVEEQKSKSAIEQCDKKLDEDAGELDGGIGEMGPLFLLAIPFLIVAANYRSRARKAKECNDLEMMRMYTAKAMHATKCGKLFAAIIGATLGILFLCGLVKFFTECFV